MTKRDTKVFVAMSGGVDSSVTAALLKSQGYDVRGVYMKEWKPDGIECTADTDRQMATRVAAHLDIPFRVWDFRDEYKKQVADYMTGEYMRGRTPNPDVMCNSTIKFGAFLERARREGADYIATGHYVRLANSKWQIANSKSEKLSATSYSLLAARDASKDQSYFLWQLTQDQLQHCLFPLGEYQKPRVREIAKELGLPSWDKKDSQGVCFVGKLRFADFLRSVIPQRQGVVVTTSGEEIGTHDGAPYFTIGQRHGLGLGMRNQELGMPLYVADKDIETNTIVVAKESDPVLYRKELVARDMNWIAGTQPNLPLRCQARVRYRQPLQWARVSLLPDSRFLIRFEEPQRAITPGQSAVFYSTDGELLGGGIIE